MSDGASDIPTPVLSRRGAPRRYWALIPVLLALVMAAPTIHGGFLSGDDIQLVRDHVLVNRFSVGHFIELFSIPHRDLYQPIPLATFALDFAVMRALGLTPSATGPGAGAWIPHLTNILVHALNAFLVWWLIREVTGTAWLALAVGSLFAIHPLHVECVAWLNGRMMMLSTTFTVAALISAHRAFERPSPGQIVLTVLLAILAMMSKVSVGLPVLMLLIPFLRRQRPGLRWWGLFVLIGVVTAVFVVLNFRFSGGRLDVAGDALEGSRFARAVIALGWYVSHYFVPAGLAPWHPTEKLVTFSHPQFLSAAATMMGLLVTAALLLRYSRTGAAGLIWFLVTIAVIVPLVTMRNVFVAERYAYLPTIGLHWTAAAGCAYVLGAGRRGRGAPVPESVPPTRERRGTHPRVAWLLVGTVCVVASTVLVGIAWKTSGYYRDDVARCRRTVELYSDHPGFGMRLAWAHFQAGEYAEAVEAAERELDRYPEQSVCEVRQVQGMVLLRTGLVDQALVRLADAVALDPDDGMAHSRLAAALREAGQAEDAIVHYLRALEIMPGRDPVSIALGQTYHGLGRVDEAAEVFEQVLEGNPYNPLATTVLAELELARGDVAVAAERLERLLAWMPENAVAHANLGVCYVRLGRLDDAQRAYRAALALEPTSVPPRVGLASLLAQADLAEEADRQFRMAVEYSGYVDTDVLLAYSDFLISRDDFRAAAALWSNGLERNPDDPVQASWYAWVSVLAEQWELARRFTANLTGSPALSPTDSLPIAAVLTSIMLDMHSNRPERAVATAADLCADRSEKARDAQSRLQRALKGYSARHPRSPCPCLLMILLFDAEDRPDAARVALQAFEELNTDPEWTARARGLVSSPTAPPAALP